MLNYYQQKIFRDGKTPPEKIFPDNWNLKQFFFQDFVDWLLIAGIKHLKPDIFDFQF